MVPVFAKISQEDIDVTVPQVSTVTVDITLPVTVPVVKILTSVSYAAISVSMGLASTVTGLLNASVVKDFTLIVTALHALVRFVTLISTK